MRLRLTATALVALTAAAAIAGEHRAAATPAQELVRARGLFRGGDFAGALPLLNYLLYPTPRLSQPADLVEAHVLLGVCAYETGDRKTAKREFEEALFLQRDLTLDTLLFSAEAVEFFDDTRADLEDKEKRDADQRRLAEENERLARALQNLVVIETRPFYVNIIPFGAGQFQNGDRGKGLFFASAEAVTGAASAGIWLYLVSKYGIPGQVPPEEAATARRLQQVEIGTGAVCLGLMAWGIVDSLLHYKPSVRVAADESLLPDEVRDRARGGPPRGPEGDGSADDPPRAPPPAPAPQSRLQLSPTIIPSPGAHGAGLSLTWEF